MTLRSSVCLLLFSAFFQSRADTIITTCTEISLRNELANGGLIQLNCSNVITLTQPIVITVDTVLFATNNTGTISGGNSTRLFVVNPGVSLTISNIALFSGRHTDTNLNDGGIPDTAGAGIYNNGGTVRVYKSTVQSHVVVGTTGRPGDAGLEGEAGESGGDAAGGAIFNREGTLILSNVVFRANQATGGIGGKGGDGTGSFGGEGGDGGNGGSAGGAAVYSQGGTVQLFRCDFTNNSAAGALGGAAGVGSGLMGFHGTPGDAGEAIGGAVASDSYATLLIDSCSFVSNTATGAKGHDGANGLRNLDGSEARAGGSAAGGAILAGGVLNLTNSTLTANSATGGDGGTGGNGVAGAFGTDGGRGGNGGHASGGAVDSTGDARVINCTFSDNVATPGNPGAGGEGTGVARDGDPGDPGLVLGGSVANSSGTLSLANSILANSIPHNAGGSITDLGGNMSNDSTPVFTQPSSRVSTNPRLGAPATFGEFVLTLPIPTNSPALNAALSQFCPPVDQRGSNRWQQCDIGAFEFNGGVLVTPTNVNVTIGSSILTTNLTNALAISWPTNAHNLRLFMNTNLAGSNWTQVITSPVTVGLDRVVTVPFTNTQAFFRLSDQPVGGLPPVPGAAALPPDSGFSAVPGNPAPPGVPALPPFPQ